jgi:hypothetical protein
MPTYLISRIPAVSGSLLMLQDSYESVQLSHMEDQASNTAGRRPSSHPFSALLNVFLSFESLVQSLSPSSRHIEVARAMCLPYPRPILQPLAEAVNADFRDSGEKLAASLRYFRALETALQMLE